jgi:alkylated DNA repair dioxygenase AlkB
MAVQFNFFQGNRDQYELTPQIEGFRYQPELIEPSEEEALVTRIRELPFKEFEFILGYKGKRRVVSFGWQYDYSGQKLRKADAIPEFLLPLRLHAASFAGLDPEALQQVLVTEYRTGAGIGWHRDKPVFDEVVGVSLLAPCVLRFRRKVEESTSNDRDRKPEKSKIRAKWERVNVLAEPRSAYFLSGPARSVWQHSILGVDSLRYAITFRSMRDE